MEVKMALAVEVRKGQKARECKRIRQARNQLTGTLMVTSDYQTLICRNEIMMPFDAVVTI